MPSRTAAALLLALAGVPAGKGAPSAPAVAPTVEGAPETPAIRLATPDEVVTLCRTLEPAERLRPKGDAVSAGEAALAHEQARETAALARYEVLVPAARLPFAPYDGAGRRLLLERGGFVPLEDGLARLWPTEEAGLPVEVDGPAARRILEAQKAGRLLLSLVFDLDDDVACGSGPSGKARYTLPVEPVAWRWLDGERVLARGGAGAERPLLTVSEGAAPRVVVGEPLAGPPAAQRAVLERAPALEACYGEALRRDPGADGVLVAELGGAAPKVAADSVGDAELASCVLRALAGAARTGGKAAVPIRFELVPPEHASGGAGR